MDPDPIACKQRTNRSTSGSTLQHAILLLLIVFLSQAAGQPILQTIKSFGRLDAATMTPEGNLVEGSDGYLYGVADAGGSNLVGSVFKLSRNGSDFSVLHHFSISPDDGRNPRGGLIKGSDGTLYGTTYFGGVSNWGTIFKINQDGSGFALLHHFTGGSGGLEPERRLVEGSDGLLYGTTQTGGDAGTGMIFKLNKDGTGFEIIYHFLPGFFDPTYPITGLIEGRDGGLYGTTSHGGGWNWGTVFRVEKDGSNFEVLHFFGSISGDGSSPNSELLQADDGALYGTTLDGGTNGVGVVYRMTTNASNFSILHTFRTGVSDGNGPSGRLIQGSDHLLYGTTQSGGGAGRGTIYKIQTSGAGYLVLHNFQGATEDGLPAPNQGVIEGSDGLLYGATYAGGTLDHGFIYKLNKNGSSYAAVYSFIGPQNDGAQLSAPLTEGSDSFLYGITEYGGASGGGTVFKIRPDGTDFLSLHSFTNVDRAQRSPRGGIIEASDGRLYGVTSLGGTSNAGTVFTLDRDGRNFATLHQFSGGTNDGVGPQGRLLEGADGLLYGTTDQGGASRAGTVFRANKNGSGHTILHHFSANRIDGAAPQSGLIQGTDGMLYGITRDGGPGDVGTVFKLNTNGADYATLHTFTNAPGEGVTPLGDLIEARNGALYGTTAYGGTFSRGTVFTLAKDGNAYSVLFSFGGPGDDSSYSIGGVIEANDGALYGTTLGSPNAPGGTIYRLNKDGSGYSILHRFLNVPSAGSSPLATFVQATDGKLYGTTYEGGEFQNGTIFSFEFAVRIAVQLSGDGARLQFSGLTGATYEIQRAPDLAGPWDPIDRQVTPTNGVIEVYDSPLLPGTCFYRARVLRHQ